MPSVSNFQQSRPLKSSALAQSTLSILHDHNKLMTCQPLVGQIDNLATAPDRAQADERTSEHHWFRQTEYIPFLPFGIWKKKVVFENYFKDLPDTPVPTSSTTPTSESQRDPVEGGVASKVYAPGLEIEAVFKVVKRKPHYSKDTLRKRDSHARKDAVEAGWSIVEETQMTCKNSMIKWISVPQHRSAHKQMLDRIIFEASKRAYGAPVTET